MQTLLGHPLVSPTVGTHAGPPGAGNSSTARQQAQRETQEMPADRSGEARAGSGPGTPCCSGHATHRDKACPQASSPWHSSPDAEGPGREGFLSCLFPSLQA